MHFHYVRAVKFFMFPSNHHVSGNLPVYKLPIDAYMVIVFEIEDLDFD